MPAIGSRQTAAKQIAWGATVSPLFKGCVIDMCEELDINPNELMTCLAYFCTRDRLSRAAALMPEWPGSFADLAVAAGFADQAHFTRGISAMTGKPPGHWRVKSVQA